MIKVKPILLIAAIVFFLSMTAGALHAQKIELSIAPKAISFSAADPDLQPQVPADQPVQVSIKVPGNRGWQLTIRANGNLYDVSSLAEISISQVNWTVTSVPPFRNGTLAANIEQVVASSGWGYNGWGDLSFFFRNEWSYWAGSYAQTVTFTLAVI